MEQESVIACCKYFGTQLLIWISVAGFLIGGSGLWLGFGAGVIFWIGGDALSGRFNGNRALPYPAILEAALYSLFPSLVAMSVSFAWAMGNEGDLFGIGAFTSGLFGYDALSARESSGMIDYLGASLSFGLSMAMGGILGGHELIHRTKDPMAMFVGRWMLAMAFNSSLEVAHVFGHHSDVATAKDPATARRGENIYAFFVRSTAGQVFQALAIERDRLRGVSPLLSIVRNKVVRGYARSLTVGLLMLLAAGGTGIAVYGLSVLWNKLLLETLNYVSHYGLVRADGGPVELRHAWDSDNAFSNYALFHFPWHAEHHVQPRVAFERLQAEGNAPNIERGYLATIPLVFVPSAWRAFIAPKLEAWDEHYATDEEKAML